jgi:hypothetical protein
MNLPIKKYLIVGSAAMGCRPAKDIDVICYKGDIEVETSTGDDYACSFMHNGWKIECLLADKQESFQEFLKDAIVDEEGPKDIASEGVLFAIKAGHITFPHRQWEKHIMDYHILKKIVYEAYNPLGIVWIEKMTKLHKKCTEDRLGKQKLPKLIGTTKEEFFDDYVVKYVEHDSIHQMVAHKEFPMYHYMQKDHTLVECHKELWDQFSHEDKLHCVMEECYVIALERHIIPTIKGDRVGLNYHDAFKWALMRVCTTLCSGWFRQFAIDHYFEVLNSYNKEYYKLLKLPD